MDTIQAIKSRRSVRAYKPDPIPQEVLDDILDCGRLAPTGHNSQNWRFVVVTDAAMRARFAQEAMYGKFFEQAPVCIVVFTGKEATTPMEDASAATTAMMYAAQAYGLGTCWVASFQRAHSNAIKELLGAPEGWELMTMFALGVPAGGSNMPRKKALEEIVAYNKF